MFKNIVEPDRPQMTVWCMRVSCWIPKATDIHSEYEYVIRIAFPPQQRSHERSSVLRYTYIAGLFNRNPTNEPRFKPKPV